MAFADKITYYHFDLLGSPVAATNDTGQVIWHERYGPYGDRQLLEAASAKDNVWFTSRHEDGNTELVYMGARYYEPMAGRFLAVDPKAFDEGNIHSFNRYAYANNNPYRYVDPDGRDSKEAKEAIQRWWSNSVAGFKSESASDFAWRALQALPAEAGMVGAVGAVKNLSATEKAVAKATANIKEPAAKGLGNIAGGATTAENALVQAEVWLGQGYKEIAPGVFRSADNTRQFRATVSDLKDLKQGPHVHFEAIGADGRTIVENSHVGITNP